jgi:hypothetical protein
MSRYRAGGTRRLGSLLCALYPLLGGCASDALPSTAPGGVNAAVSSSIGTVVNVTWKTTTPTIGYVSYGTTPSVELSLTIDEPDAAATDHSRTLLGLTPNTTYYYQVITWDIVNATAGTSDVKSFHTAALPADAPQLTAQSFEVTDEDGDIEPPLDALVLVPFIGADSTTIGVVDPAGALVWYHVEDRDRRVTRARFSSDKTAVLYSAISDATPADSEIVRVPLDGSASSALSVPNLGEDFAVLTNGTLAALVPDTQTVSGESVTGDSIVEIDSAGAQNTVWSSFDCFDPATSPGDGTGSSWTGANALQVTGTTTYYVSLRNLGAIAGIHRETGECEWILGDDAAGTLELSASSETFSHPGSFFADSKNGQLVVLDADGGSNGSRMLAYELDLETMTAAQTQSYDSSPRIDVSGQGEATLVRGQDVRINWSNGSRMDVIDPQGKLKWTLSVTSGERLGYHTSFRDFYAPKVEGNQ